MQKHAVYHQQRAAIPGVMESKNESFDDVDQAKLLKRLKAAERTLGDRRRRRVDIALDLGEASFLAALLQMCVNLRNMTEEGK